MIRGPVRALVESAAATTAASSSSRRRTILLAWVVASAAILGVAMIVAAGTWETVAAAHRVGGDFDLYLGATRGVLDGSPLYPGRQVGGPYLVTDGDILYPPPILALMIPFTVLPAALFWLVPLGIILTVVIRHRPAPCSWPVLALALAAPTTSLKIAHGNPAMWIVAAVALATVTAGPAVFVLLKPTLAPFALLGANRRRWWIALGVAVLIAAAFAPLWPEYVRVLLNARYERGAFYSLDEVPFALIPIVAWVASPQFRRPRLSLGGRAAGANERPATP